MIGRAFRGLLPGTIAGRAVVILLLALTLSHLLSMWWYQMRLADQVGLADERVAAERIASIKQAIIGTPPQERERRAHSLSGRGIDAHWNEVAIVGRQTASDERLDPLRQRLRQMMPETGSGGLRLAHADEDAGTGHLLLVSTRLPDDGWLNLSVTTLGSTAGRDRHFVVPTTLMSLAILTVAVFLVRACTAEFRTLARAARRLGVDVGAPPLPVRGPEEVREAAQAFNEMQGRVRALLTDRTQMLAAISHDLRTPITAIRLRAEFIEDDEERNRILAQLDEMEAMISATLAFLREDGGREEAKVVDIRALLETICDEMADAGRPVHCDGPADVTLRCRRVALKRALSNLIDNAVKYGGAAAVSLRARPDRLEIRIEDEGPGIPEAEMEKAFDPFYRIEASRNRQTGGFGLGLTVARSIARAHGGDIILENRRTGGLRVTVVLPRVV